MYNHALQEISLAGFILQIPTKNLMIANLCD